MGVSNGGGYVAAYPAAPIVYPPYAPAPVVAAVVVAPPYYAPYYRPAVVYHGYRPWPRQYAYRR